MEQRSPGHSLCHQIGAAGRSRDFTTCCSGSISWRAAQERPRTRPPLGRELQPSSAAPLAWLVEGTGCPGP